MPTYRTRSGTIIETPQRHLGQGGEADVFAVNNAPDIVAKIYTKAIASNGRLTELGRRAEQKLDAMIENPPPTRDADGNVALVWPEDILYCYGGASDGLMAGFTMPKIDTDQYRDVLNYYNPAQRARLNQSLSSKNLRVPTEGEDLENLLSVIVRNILTVIREIHKLGYVIGDVNESNILVDYMGRVAFVDSDSFQVPDGGNATVHRSPVGKEDFLSPRVIRLMDEKCIDRGCACKRRPGRNKSFLCFDRSPEDDNFAIAVILFKLLVNGIHPFNSVGGSLAYREKIARREFPYNGGNASKLAPPPRRGTAGSNCPPTG